MHVTLMRGPLVSTALALNNEATPAIGLAYIAGYLEQFGHQITFVDGIAEGLNKVWPAPGYEGYLCQGLTFDEIIDRIPPETDAIGFSAMFSGEWPVQRDLLTKIRRHFPNTVIIAGGEHISALTEYVLRDCPALDYCVRGEGEHTFYEVIENIAAKKDPNEIKGVCYIGDDGTYVTNENAARLRDMKSIPWPCWPDGYMEKFWTAGKSFGIQSERDMPIIASRGCPYQCTFCSSPQMWTTRYVLRDIDDMIDEIKAYIEKYDITSLQFYDLTAITKKPWTVEYCNRLISEGINLNWSLPSGTRSEVLDDETLGLLKQTGCNYLVYAPESGSPTTLKRIKKRISLENLTSSILIARKTGIVVRANLILGFPGESRWNVFRTMVYGFKLVARGVDEVSTNLFSPYPGSELFAELNAQEKVELSDQYFLSLTSLNSDLSKINPMTVNEHMGARELAIYRAISMFGGYALGYLLRPLRILRSLRNVLGSSGSAATVFEHRLKDSLKRKREKKASNVDL